MRFDDSFCFVYTFKTYNSKLLHIPGDETIAGVAVKGCGASAPKDSGTPKDIVLTSSSKL